MNQTGKSGEPKAIGLHFEGLFPLLFDVVVVDVILCRQPVGIRERQKSDKAVADRGLRGMESHKELVGRGSVDEGM